MNENEESKEPTEEIESQSQEQSDAGKMGHRVFEDGKLVLVQHPETKEIFSKIKAEQALANLKMAENEDLVLQQVDRRLDEAFYRMWSADANDYFRLQLRFRRRSADLNITQDEVSEESA